MRLWCLVATGRARAPTLLASRRVPYGVGWWAFTFPLGALTLATSSLADAWKLPFVSDIALGLPMGLVALWLVVTAGTIGSVATGQAWARPPAVPPVPAGTTAQPMTAAEAGPPADVSPPATKGGMS